jgi:hypothetical protein
MATDVMIDFFLDSVRLACPCGKPLHLARTDDGRWVVGALDHACSPLVHGPDAEGVLARAAELFRDPDKAREPWWPRPCEAAEGAGVSR